MDTSICVWFYQEVFPKLNYTQSIHSELLFSFKKTYCKISEAFLQGLLLKCSHLCPKDTIFKMDSQWQRLVPEGICFGER